MFIPGIGFGGGRSTSTNTVNIDTSTVVEKMTNTTVSTDQQTFQSSMNIQTAEFENKGTVEGNVTLGQLIDVTQQITATINEEIINNLQTELMSELDAKLKQQSQASSGILSLFAKPTSTKNTTDIRNAFRTSIQDTITVPTVQKIYQDVLNVQTGKITNEGTIIGDVIIDNKIIVRLTIVNLIQKVFNNTNKILAENKTGVQVQQSAKSSSGELFAMGDTGAQIASVCVCLFIMLCCGLLVFMLPKIIDSGTKAGQTYVMATNPAAGMAMGVPAAPK